MAMSLDDYSGLLDALENVRGHGPFHDGPSAHRKVVQGSEPSLAKARLLGTNGKLGQNGPVGTTASQGNLALSRSAERQYFDGQDRVARSYRARQAGRVADILAEWG